ncbi:RNA methyltransferase [Olsenella sp. An285]|uniref:TrmH family RNA methyltransferase n=1 Tax=Olsenella sp. An285 TaxID=1965621 RepID=UPI000B55D6C9|nr:RNA methyltransferase [Olsenella sp. An285]OUO46750.1 RNA methyltransferase [Olsenella sp. An285]
MAVPVRLDDLGDPRLDAYARLTEHQLRSLVEEERAMLVAETRLVVEAALDARVEPLSFLVDERHLESVRDLLGRTGDDVPAFVLPHDQMERLTGYRVTRGLLCAMRRPRPRSVEEVLEGARYVAVIEDLVDVTNVGALFRSAAALGADGVILSPRCADPYVRRAVRTSMGTVFSVPWARAKKDDWPEATIGALRERGFSVLALALEPDAVPLDDPSLKEGSGRRALLFGSEGYGLSRRALDACDRSVIIPMAHGVDSLNVAASSAVAFWQLFR